MQGQMNSMVSLLDALHRPNPFMPHFPYHVIPTRPLSASVPAPQAQYQCVNGWSYHPPRMPATGVYQYPNLSYSDTSCGAEIQSLSSPDVFNAALLQQDGLVQPGETRSQQLSSQLSSDLGSPPLSSRQFPSQEQCLSPSVEPPHLSSQNATVPKKPQKVCQVKCSSTELPKPSNEQSTERLAKSRNTWKLRSASKSAATNPSSSVVQQPSVAKSGMPKNPRQRKKHSAKVKKQ